MEFEIVEADARRVKKLRLRLKSHAKDTQWRRDSFDVVLGLVS